MISQIIQTHSTSFFLPSLLPVNGPSSQRIYSIQHKGNPSEGLTEASLKDFLLNQQIKGEINKFMPISGYYSNRLARQQQHQKWFYAPYYGV
jgi:hypothetical protein